MVSSNDDFMLLSPYDDTARESPYSDVAVRNVG